MTVFTSEQREERLRVLKELTERLSHMDDVQLAQELLTVLIKLTRIEIMVKPAHPTPTVAPELRLASDKDQTDWLWLSCLAAEKANRQL